MAGKKAQGEPASIETVLGWLEEKGTAEYRTGLGRYGITAPKAYGVAMGDIKAIGKRVGRDHELAAGLWETGWYEARLLCAFVGEPAKVTPAQMDQWAKDFDNWAVCDTLCFHLFDRTPHAWGRVKRWSNRREEFVKRAAFALLASIAGHDKKAPDDPFLDSLKLIEQAAADERNFVKKGVSWALRHIGQRNLALHAEAVELAGRLCESEAAASRWVGRDALKDLTRAVVQKRLAGRSKPG